LETKTSSEKGIPVLNTCQGHFCWHNVAKDVCLSLVGKFEELNAGSAKVFRCYVQSGEYIFKHSTTTRGAAADKSNTEQSPLTFPSIC
jgi:hypothetical protein